MARKGWEQGHRQSYQSVPDTVVDHRPNGLHGLAINSRASLPWRAFFSQSPRFASVQPHGTMILRRRPDILSQIRVLTYDLNSD